MVLAVTEEFGRLVRKLLNEKKGKYICDSVAIGIGRLFSVRITKVNTVYLFIFCAAGSGQTKSNRGRVWR